jgi:hypothetical protein
MAGTRFEAYEDTAARSGLSATVRLHRSRGTADGRICATGTWQGQWSLPGGSANTSSPHKQSLSCRGANGCGSSSTTCARQPPVANASEA